MFFIEIEIFTSVQEMFGKRESGVYVCFWPWFGLLRGGFDSTTSTNF